MELEGGLAYSGSGLHFGTDLLCDLEQVVQISWASVNSWRASAVPSAIKFSFNVCLTGLTQGVESAQLCSWSKLRN